MLKRLLFICYWGVEDSLTRATVLPRLEALHQRNDVEQVVLVTIERENLEEQNGSYLGKLNKIKHLPFHSGKGKGSVAEKVADFICIPKFLKTIASEHNINHIWAHSAPAGALAYKLWLRTKLPFYVSSFEPHSEYMAESGVWSKYGLKYFFQRYWEKKQKQSASGLMPVAENYYHQLLAEGVGKAKLYTVPCSVDSDTFAFNEAKRTELRTQLNWEHATIGIYVGKFGDLYYDDEAFLIFKKCFKAIYNFRLILVTSYPEEIIQKKLSEHGIAHDKVVFQLVPHHQVPDFLSAADFAFATVKSYPSARFCSPIKIGEYWANGLPVLLTEGVGDDSDIIRRQGGGALFNLQKEGSVDEALKTIREILQDPTHRTHIPELAFKHRSPDKIRDAFDYFFSQGKETSL